MASLPLHPSKKEKLQKKERKKENANHGHSGQRRAFSIIYAKLFWDTIINGKSHVRFFSDLFRGREGRLYTGYMLPRKTRNDKIATEIQ